MKDQNATDKIRQQLAAAQDEASALLDQINQLLSQLKPLQDRADELLGTWQSRGVIQQLQAQLRRAERNQSQK